MSEPVPEAPIEDQVLHCMTYAHRWFWPAAILLFAVVVSAFFAWLQQVRTGLGVTGLDCPVFWGLYIINFVFFVGISHAGTLISAILRVTGAGWRRPITRLAEAITVFALMVGPINVFFDIGRPDRVLNMVKHGQFNSPLMWDVVCITAYFVGSVTYLFLPLLPDIAVLRDRGVKPRWLYRILALNWHGTARQERLLHRAISVMAIIIIPVAVSVHTVVSWVFAMTVKPMWHSSIFGPYFVVGAIYSGIATLIIAMAIMRRALHMEAHMKPKHFHYLGLLLLTMALLWLYFTFAEHLTAFYGQSPAEMQVLNAKLYGAFSVPFWIMVLSTGVAFFVLALPLIPVRQREPRPAGLHLLLLLRSAVPVGVGALAVHFVQQGHRTPSAAYGLPAHVTEFLSWAIIVLAIAYFVWTLTAYLRDHPISRMVIASILVNIGMWLERYLIVVPTLSYPQLSYGASVEYHPSWIEWRLMAGCVAGLALLFVLFARFFPMLPIWELKQGQESGHGA